MDREPTRPATSPPPRAALLRPVLPQLRLALTLLLLLLVLTGIVYPLAVTLVARLLFPDQAAGSLVRRDGHTVGSLLIGQSFTDPGHFCGRPLATTPQPYNGTASGGSNLGPLNPALTDAMRARVVALRAADPNNNTPVPIDLVTASGSGLDPEISVAAAVYQAPRVARARGLDVAQVRGLIATHSKGSVAGVLGEPRVNVLELNLALD